MYLQYFYNLNPIFLIIAAIAIITFVVQMLYFFMIYSRFRSTRGVFDNQGAELPPVSIVVCIRDEVSIVKNDIIHFLNQEYPCFEIIIVNSSSNSKDTLLFDSWAKQKPNLTIVHLDEKQNFKYSKIFPLSIGVKAAKYDTILITNLNCRPTTPYWIRSMVDASKGGKRNVLGTGNFHKTNSLGNKLLRYERSKYNINMLSFLKAGFPFTVSTTNFLFKRRDLLLHNCLSNYFTICNDGSSIFIKNSGKKTSGAISNDYSQIVMQSKMSFNSWFRSLTFRYGNYRFASAGSKIVKSAYIISYILFLMALLLCVVNKWALISVGTLFLIRFFVWFVFRRKSLKIIGQPELIRGIVFYELLLAIILPFAYFGSLMVKKNLWN